MTYYTLLAAQEPLGKFEGEGIFMNPSSFIGANSLSDTFAVFASTIFGFLTIIAGLSFLLYFVTGALSWITSGGDTAKIEKARNQMTNAAIGLVAVIAAYTIAGIVSLILGINILNPYSMLSKLGPGNSTDTSTGTTGPQGQTQ